MTEVSVKNYGAVGNGKNADQAAFQKAIADAASKGCVLRIPKGVYRIESTITVENLRGIVMVGDPGAVLQCTPKPKYSILEFRDCENIRISGITFDGNYAPLDPLDYGNHGIAMNKNTTHATITDCTFYRINDTSIQDRTQSNRSAEFAASKDVKISHIIVTRNRFIDCNSCFNTKGGGSSYGIISHNHYERCNCAVKMDGETFGSSNYPSIMTSWLISNNICREMGYLGDYAKLGIHVFALEERISNITVLDNEVHGTRGIGFVGIGGGQTGQPVENIRILNNRVSRTENDYGIRISASSPGVTLTNITIEGNEFFGSTRGFCLVANTEGTIQGLTITRNRFVDWSTGDASADDAPNTHGVELALTRPASRIAIHDNEFIRAAKDYRKTYALQINAAGVENKADLVVSGNTFRNAQASDNLVYLFNGPLILRENMVAKGNVLLYGVDAEVLDNWIEGTVMLNAYSSKKSQVNLENNRLIQGADPQAVRVQSSTVNASGNRFDPAYQKPFLTASGGSVQVR